ncbi:MAG: ankyrin repeat domain-containing protein [Clostridiales bacterium]|nr:ankyrin repeat domain-containing protein [Clostridiales bacterium]
MLLSLKIEDLLRFIEVMAHLIIYRCAVRLVYGGGGVEPMKGLSGVYFLDNLKKCVDDMTSDRIENQIMQVMGLADNRLGLKKIDMESLYCNLASIILENVDTKDEDYDTFEESFKRSYDIIFNGEYKEEFKALKDNNAKSFVIVPILASTPMAREGHMFFAVVTKVQGECECVLVNKGYRPKGAFTYQKCINKKYEDLMEIFTESKKLKVFEIYEKLSGDSVDGVNAMNQKTGNCACKNLEAAINCALCIAYPKYKKYERIPEGVFDKAKMHRLYLDNLKDVVKSSGKFDEDFINFVEDKWKEYIYNKIFLKKINRLKNKHIRRKMEGMELLESFEKKCLQKELEEIGVEVSDLLQEDKMDDEWAEYTYNRKFNEKVIKLKEKYMLKEGFFEKSFFNIFKEIDIKSRLKYVSSRTLWGCYENFLLLAKNRSMERLYKILYVMDKNWLDKYAIYKIESIELDKAVYFLNLLEEYFPAAVRELKLTYSEAYARYANAVPEKEHSEKFFEFYRKGVECLPYKSELDEIFEKSYGEVVDVKSFVNYKYILSVRDRKNYELLTSEFMRGKKKILKSLSDILKKNKEKIKEAFLVSNNSGNFLKFSDIDFSEIKTDVENMSFKDENGLMDVVSRITDNNVLSCINFEKIDTKKLFFKTLSNGNFELTKNMLEFGVDVNIATPSGDTALMVACLGENEEVVRLLLSKKARLNEKYMQGLSAVKFIDDYGISENVAKIVLEAVLDKKDLNSNMEGEGSLSPLMYALRRSNISLVKVLISLGVDVNCVDKYANTPLKDICSSTENITNIRIAKLLIDNGADINKENYRGITALMIACCSDNIGFVKLLLVEGADVLKKNKNGKTALDMAQEIDNKDMINLLRKKTVPIDKVDIKKDKGIERQKI